MGLFNKSAGGADQASSKPRKLKKSERLSSVINETVTEQVMSDVRANQRFDVTCEDKLWHVCLFLQAKDIGGLSKKTNKDPDKGSIVECMTNGRIKIIATKPLLDCDSLLIVPDTDTLEAIEEFHLLVDAPYQCAFVSDDGSKIFLSLHDGEDAVDITFQDALDIAHPDGMYANVADFLKQAGVPWLADSQVASNAPQTAFVTDDDDDLDEPIELNETASAADVTTQLPPVGAGAQHVPAGNGAAYATNQQQADARSVAAQVADNDFGRVPQQPLAPVEPAREVAPAEMVQEISKSFYTEDLGITASLAAFDRRFPGIQDNFLGFADKKLVSSGFIGEHLMEMRANANDELRRMHQENVTHLRERYMTELDAAIKSIQAQLTIDPRSDGEFANERRAIEQRAEDRRGRIKQQAEQMRTQLEATFNQSADAYGERARSQAITEYREQHAPEHQHQMRQVEVNLENDVQMMRADELADMYEDRRNEARRLLEQAEAEIINRLAGEYELMCRQETKRFGDLGTQMADWLDENRVNDIAYAEAIRNKEQIDAAIATANAKNSALVKQVQAQAAAEVDRLKAQLADARAERERVLLEREHQHQLEIDRMASEQQTLSDDRARLIDQVNHAREAAAAEVAEQVSALEHRVEDRDDRIMKMTQHQRRLVWLFIAILVVCIVGSVCIGLIYGTLNGASLMSSIDAVVLS